MSGKNQMTNANLALWTAVEKTPLEHTKKIEGKSYKGTSPKPHYLIHKATETFGPCGIGWGFTVDERIEDGHAPGIKMHIAKVRVWYVWNEKRGEVEHIGGTVFSGTNKNGPFTDEDAPKKSVTDALVKALSMIGFAGDIFMGRYDDSKYVAELQDEARTNGHAKEPPAKSARETYIEKSQALIPTFDAPAPLKTWWTTQSQMRRDADLTQADVNDLKARLLTHINILSAG